MIERIYVINVRKKVIKTAKYKRTNKAIKVIREYIIKHMKSDNVKLDKELNEKVWSRGVKNPVMKVKVKAAKDDDGKVTVSLIKELKQK